MSIHQEVVFNTTPARIYEALMNSEQHTTFTGAPAEISRDVGGTFSAHGGHVVGRNVELVPGKRIVQAWRIADWAEGVYSIVRFELQSKGGETRLVLDHEAVPEDRRAAIESGWQVRYWEPLKKFLA